MICKNISQSVPWSFKPANQAQQQHTISLATN